jgi:glycosyltransferase involved in cell wall biosynthesis
VLQCGLTVGGSGGVDRYLQGLLPALRNAHVKCAALAALDSGPFDNERGEITTFARSTSPMFWRWWKAYRCSTQFFQRDEPSLLAAHFAPYTWPLLWKARTQPLVVHFHGPWCLESEAEGHSSTNVRIKRSIENRVYRQAVRFITLSKAFARVLECTFGIPPERIRVIPGGVDVNRFAPIMSRGEARAHLGWPIDRPIVVTVRRLVNRMGLLEFIDAVAIARRQHPDLLVQMCGTGKLSGELSSKIKSMGLQNTVNLLGHIDDANLPLVYRAADFSAVPSLQFEGFGLAAAESLASGTPVIATRVGGLPELIGDLSDILIVEPNSVSIMADRLTQILGSKAVLPTETACRDHATRCFAWPKVAHRIINVYREAMMEAPLPYLENAQSAANLEPAGTN